MSNRHPWCSSAQSTTDEQDAEQQDEEQQDADQLGEAAETLGDGSPSPEATPIEGLPVVATRTTTLDDYAVEVDPTGFASREKS